MFCMVNSRSTVSPGATGSLVKDFVRSRSALVTVSVSEAFPALTKSASKSPDTFVREPTLLPTTSTVTVQVAPAARTGRTGRKPSALRITDVPPAGAVKTVGKRPLSQSVLALAGEAMTMPVGKLSVKSRFGIPLALSVLSIVNVRVDVPPKLTLDGAKDLEKPGWEVLTVREPDALPLLPADDVKSPVIIG